MREFLKKKFGPVFTNVIGDVMLVVGVFVLASGIFITGNFVTVIGFAVVIIVIFEGVCWGVEWMIGSILTHFVNDDPTPEKDCSLIQFEICCWELLFEFGLGLDTGFGKITGRWEVNGGDEGTILAEGGGDGYGCWLDKCDVGDWNMR